MNRTILSFGLLVVLSAASFALALTVGSTQAGWADLWRGLTAEPDNIYTTLVWDLRLPRAASAFVSGALLAMAGALMQVLLRNPLAEPYVLGVSGGAAVGALSATLAGLAGGWLTGSAFAGALLAILLVFGLARGRGAWTPERLLLTGVVIAAGWGAVISLLLTIAPERNLRGMLFWLMGDLSQSNGPGLTGAAVLVAGVAIGVAMARPLNVLAHGDVQAAGLGISLRPLRLAVYFTASLLTAVAVTLGGNIGFVGLVVPHATRLLLGSDHRRLIPASMLIGGNLLVIADTAARSVLAPQQLPVGVITAAIGVPVFLYLLQRTHSRTEQLR